LGFFFFLQKVAGKKSNKTTSPTKPAGKVSAAEGASRISSQKTLAAPQTEKRRIDSLTSEQVRLFLFFFFLIHSFPFFSHYNSQQNKKRLVEQRKLPPAKTVAASPDWKTKCSELNNMNLELKKQLEKKEEDIKNLRVVLELHQTGDQTHAPTAKTQVRNEKRTRVTVPHLSQFLFLLFLRFLLSTAVKFSGRGGRQVEGKSSKDERTVARSSGSLQHPQSVWRQVD
jgi:hypothetical protein